MPKIVPVRACRLLSLACPQFGNQQKRTSYVQFHICSRCRWFPWLRTALDYQYRVQQRSPGPPARHIGISMAFFGSHPDLAPEWKLLVITGFLGGLTTFSTFSAEVVTLIQQQRLLLACSAISIHVIVSLAMTMLGIATVATARSL